MIGHRRKVRVVWELAREIAGTHLVRNGSAGMNPNGAQCVNVPNVWLEKLKLDWIPGNAVDFIGYSRHALLWIPGDRLGRARAGDIAVFKPELVGPEGHVDVVLDGSKAPYIGLDQNWPPGNGVSYISHDLSDLAGVIRPH